MTVIGDGGTKSFNGPGYSVINKFGVNLDIDTASVPEAIWSHGGAFPFLASGIAMDFLSSVVADDIAGTGAQKIEITWYDDSNVEFIQEFPTDGTTPVQIPGTVKLVSRIVITQAGSGTTNAGEINVVNRGGAIVYQSMEIGEGQTLSAVQMVPSGKKGIIKRVYAEYARAGAAFNDADMRFRIRLANGTILTKLPTVVSPNNTDHDHFYNAGGIELEAGDIAFWECIEVSANDTPIAAGFDLEIEDA